MKMPIFIMGTQRSGTTLLTRILSAHPSVFIQNELELEKIFVKGLKKDELVKAIADQIQTRINFSLVDKLLDDNSFVWGLKDPQLTEHIDELKQFVPDTKFIIILRDGRGVTSSYMENKWGLGTNAYTGALRWKQEVEQQEAFMSEIDGSCFCLRYEDLVADLKGVMEKVCKFLNIEFHPELVEYDKKESNDEKRRENVNTYFKPNIKIAEKWRKKLSDYEINVIESVAGDALRRNGYELIGRPLTLSKARIAYYKLHQKIIGGMQLRYRWRKSQLEAYLKKPDKN